MKVAAIIQARMGSTRLPGKVLKKVMGKSLLELQLERVKRAESIDEIIIATTDKVEDEPIVDLCKKLSISHFRGSENDVLSRYYYAAKESHVDVIVRLTSDCPLIDPDVINKTVSDFINGNYDYVTNCRIRTYPRGLDTEVFSFGKLSEIQKKAQKPYEREHVTPYFYENPQLFSIKDSMNLEDLSKYRLTVDTEEDFTLIKNIFEALYHDHNEFTLGDIISVLKENPSWFEINSHIEQKKLVE